MVAVGQRELLCGVQDIVLLHQFQTGLAEGGFLRLSLLPLAGDGDFAGGAVAVVRDGGDGGLAHAAGRHLAIAVHGGHTGVAAHPDDEVIIALPAGVKVGFGARVVRRDLQLHLGHFQRKLCGTVLRAGRCLRRQRRESHHRPQQQGTERPSHRVKRMSHRVERPSFFASKNWSAAHRYFFRVMIVLTFVSLYTGCKFFSSRSP